MVIISAVIFAVLFYNLLALADVPVVDISQQTGGQVSCSTAAMEVDDMSDISDSTAVTVVPATLTENPVPSDITSTAPNLIESQRLARLEQQMHNITNMNLPQQVTDLQQELAQICGQLQVQRHNFRLLNNQQRSFYRDLDQKIMELKDLNGGGGTLNDNLSSTKSSGNSISDNEKIQLQDSNAYQAGLNLLTNKQYRKAEAAFQNYLNNYSNGNYVANAHYWLGEIYLQRKNIHKAADEFQVVRDNFLKSKKTLDAKLKLAMIHVEMGKIAEAKRELMEIKKQHSRSMEAQLANIRLQQLEAATLTSTTP